MSFLGAKIAVLANESVDEYISKKKKGFVVKLYLEKVYDKVD